MCVRYGLCSGAAGGVPGVPGSGGFGAGVCGSFGEGDFCMSIDTRREGSRESESQSIPGLTRKDEDALVEHLLPGAIYMLEMFAEPQNHKKEIEDNFGPLDTVKLTRARKETSLLVFSLQSHDSASAAESTLLNVLETLATQGRSLTKPLLEHTIKRDDMLRKTAPTGSINLSNWNAVCHQETIECGIVYWPTHTFIPTKAFAPAFLGLE